MPQSAELVLEDMLRAWEDRCLEREAALRILEKTIAHAEALTSESKRLVGLWRTYRSTLLNNKIAQLPYEDWVLEFPQPVKELFVHLDSIGMYPLEYFAWTRKSRRVFCIPAPEQSMFSLATMSEIRWSDVLWPFESFVIELAVGIPLKLTGQRPCVCTHVLVSHYWGGESNNKKMLMVRVLDGANRPALYQRNERKDLLAALASGDLRKMMAITAAVKKREERGFLDQGSIAFAVFCDSVDDADDLVRLDEEGIRHRIEFLDASFFSQMLRGVRREIAGSLGEIARIVVGTCLYLESVASTFPPQWEKRKRMGRRYIGPLGILTDEADVCVITGRSTIDPSRADVPQLLSGQGFVRPHWRRRHRKRPPYTPTDHPKTIIVPPKLINAALVPLFGILAGSITRMLSAEEEFG